MKENENEEEKQEEEKPLLLGDLDSVDELKDILIGNPASIRSCEYKEVVAYGIHEGGYLAIVRGTYDYPKVVRFTVTNHEWNQGRFEVGNKNVGEAVSKLRNGIGFYRTVVDEEKLKECMDKEQRERPIIAEFVLRELKWSSPVERLVRIRKYKSGKYYIESLPNYWWLKKNDFSYLQNVLEKESTEIKGNLPDEVRQLIKKLSFIQEV